MNPDRAHRWVIGAWLGMIAMVTIHQMTGSQHQTGEWPSPKGYIPSAVLFSMYWLVASAADGARFAAVLAVGTDLAAAFSPYFNPGGGGPGGGVLGELQKWLAAISQSSSAQPGQPAAPAQQPAATPNVNPQTGTVQSGATPGAPSGPGTP